MTVGDAYRRLGVLLSGLEARGVEVEQVAPGETTADEPLTVELRLTVPTDAAAPELQFGASAFEASAGAPDGDAATEAPDGDGTREASAPTIGSESGAPPEPAEGPTDEHLCSDPRCTAGFDSEPALTVHRLVEHDQPDETLYRHEPALRAAYEAYDSFPEMTEALGVDVTAQTVRRNMIDHGIHDPDPEATEGGSGTADTDGQGTGDTDAPDVPDDTDRGESQGVEPSSGERPVADGSGVAVADAGTDPEGARAVADSGTEGAATAGAESDAFPSAVLPGALGGTDLREAVVEGGSLRAAADRLDRSREETRELLEELGLLDLVHGRVATRPDREERAAALEAWFEEHRGHEEAR